MKSQVSWSLALRTWFVFVFGFASCLFCGSAIFICLSIVAGAGFGALFGGTNTLSLFDSTTSLFSTANAFLFGKWIGIIIVLGSSLIGMHVSLVYFANRLGTHPDQVKKVV
jgi:hypothetical protein